MKTAKRRPDALTFIRRLRKILPDHVLESFVDERYVGLTMGVLAASMLRQRIFLHKDNRAYDPVCIGWQLDPVPRGKLAPLWRSWPTEVGGLLITKVIQPRIPKATVAVFETIRPEQGHQLLVSSLNLHTGRKVKEVSISDLRDNGFPLAAAHTRQVVLDLIVTPRLGVQSITSVFYEESVGRSLFVLTYEIDKIGERHDFWYEVEIISHHRGDNHGFYRARRHDDLDVLIPENSLVAIAGVDWVEDFGG